MKNQTTQVTREPSNTAPVFAGISESDQIPSLDSKALSDLEKYGEDVLREVADLFVAELAARSVNLQTALERRDFPQLRHHAHALKGCSANIGATRMAVLCRNLEVASQKVDLMSAIGVLNLLKLESRLLQMALRERLSRQ